MIQLVVDSSYLSAYMSNTCVSHVLSTPEIE